MNNYFALDSWELDADCCDKNEQRTALATAEEDNTKYQADSKGRK